MAVFLFGFCKCSSPELQRTITLNTGDSVVCTAEDTVLSGQDLLFKDHGFAFYNAGSRSLGKARSGNASSRVTSEHPYGMTAHIGPVSYGDQFTVSVWRHESSDGGILSLDGDWGIRMDEKEAIQKDGEWELLQIRVNIKKEVYNKTLKVLCWMASDGKEALFDDLKIIKTGSMDVELPDEVDEDQLLSISLDSAAMSKLSQKREEALEKGILFGGKNDYVKAKLYWQGEKIKAEIRLKGDWPDHLIGPKWSFRVKTKKSKYWNGIRHFSIQSPSTRGLLDEWIFHQLLDREGLLNTRYDFVNIAINDTLKGLYAYEEHFTKNLIENKQRREGHILKFNEDQLWKARLKQQDSNTPFPPIFEASEIETYDDKSIYEDPAKMAQFELAQNLLYQYKFGLAPPGTIFDVEQLAKYIALVDLAKAYHALIWHNQRWYYNPVTSLLEPIGFDGYSESGINGPELRSPLIGYKAFEEGSSLIHVYAIEHLMRDRHFFERYLHYATAYSQPEYLSSFFDGIGDLLKQKEALIQEEYRAYSYDKVPLLHQAEQMRAFIHEMNLSSILDQKESIFPPSDYKSASITGETPQKGIAAVAYRTGKKGDYTYLVRNYYEKPITVVGGKRKGQRVKLSGNHEIAPYLILGAPDEAQFPFDSSLSSILFTIPGSDEEFKAPIVKHAPPINSNPVESIRSQKLLANSSYIYEDSNITIPAGVHSFSNDIIIPKGMVVKIEAGAKINLLNNARFISYSSINIEGTKENPALIHSSDHTGSFTVLQAKGRSNLKHTRFENLNTIDDKGWVLTGGVTFYESDVTMTNIAFVSNHCEDALNTIRCSFNLDQCSFENTFGDAFDADFCSGTISNSTFSTTGNDAIDFSGSTVNVTNCQVEFCGDKAVSIGESSTATIEDLTVNGSVVGVSSKDQSRVSIKNITLSDCRYSFAIFQKKPEFGPATIRVNGNMPGLLELPYLVDKGSKLWIEDDVIVGTKKHDIDKLFY